LSAAKAEAVTRKLRMKRRRTVAFLKDFALQLRLGKP